MRRETFEAQENRNKIMKVLQSGRTLSATDIAEETGLTTKQIGAMLIKSVNEGKVFKVGETISTKYKTVLLYSINASAMKPAVSMPTVKQSWFSALMVAA